MQLRLIGPRVRALAALAAVLASLVLLAPLSVARADEGGTGSGITARLGVYADDDQTTVVTSLVDAGANLGPNATVGAHLLVDSISSASVDVVSAATPAFNENRYEAGGRASLRRGANELGLGYIRSVENDWASHALSASVARDLADKNTRLELGLAYVKNAVGRSADEGFHRRLDSYQGALSVTQLLDARSLVTLGYTLQRNDGFQSSPYRYVVTSDRQLARAETHPGTRMRHALAVSGQRHVLDASSLVLDYRLYRDDWGILSHTAGVGLMTAFGEHADLRVRARVYRQGAADFWRREYAQPMRYMSVDRELSTFWDALVGVKLGLHFGIVSADAKVDVLYYAFSDFARLTERVAVVADTSVGVAF